MTAYYAPPTDESDHKKQNQSLQLLAGVAATSTTNIATNTASIAAHEAVWTAYTPVITAGTGTITTKSATGRHKTIGKTVLVEIDITITTNGTGAGFVLATLPSTAAAFNFVLAGRAIAGSGNMLQGTIAASSGSVAIVRYDGLYPATDGYELVMSGVYEAA